MKSVLVLLLSPLLFPSHGIAQLLSSSGADTWVATDGAGRSLVTETQHGNIRRNRYVGIFYFIWHGAHGYDQHTTVAPPDEGVMPKLPTDTASPYDNSKILAAHPQHPQYGPHLAWHYWAEPYFGYYLPDDEWIIRKHAQMLSDAGVDVIILDVTNAYIYLPQVSKLAIIYQEMRREGKSTPSLAFIVNTSPEKTVQRLYDSLYKPRRFQDLWFYWKGKPLLLCPNEAATAETRAFFTIRRSWAWSKDQEWFGDGKDKWTWVDHTPQAYGWHESKDKPEQISVAMAEHPVFNIGRSFHDGKQPDEQRSAEGLYFAEQWKRALEVDPEFVFVTGWNEWIAMRFNGSGPKEFIGKPRKAGETFFVDLYNAEYSRDAEPVKGAFRDNYYYQLVNNIRKFKGARSLPVAKQEYVVRMDGRFADWQPVMPVFKDDAGDTFHRNHPGWGRIKAYVNNTGRNDIVTAKVAAEKEYISFYVRTAEPLTQPDSSWMQLYIGIKDSWQPHWEGFRFLLGRSRRKGKVSLERCKGGWSWEQVAYIPYRTQANELELRIPKKMLDITGSAFTLDFKWVDNAPADGDPLHWLDKGDAAPNARFRYRFIKE
ncbi:glycoside hydrolase family 71/99 protein [Chitinophaga cymbidii]|uniref:Uncharacterized protein n=1 Tax=Chitinophaga cymbidii TaxID=1096750 RepID=A0A512RGH2_9BACT|nr:hypothetical protein [Chitinophaga cymbidii]GEP94768.1 hypothetical protein CCY01nite_10280 [Chitinophaga cymbidii]